MERTTLRQTTVAVAWRAMGTLILAAGAVVACSGSDDPGGGTVAADGGTGGGNPSADATATSEPKPCSKAEECPAPTNPCEVAACSAGRCGSAPAPEGSSVPASSQVAGDCKVLTCGQAGDLVAAADTSDVPADDGNPCTREACDGSNPTHPNKDAGTSCDDGDAGAGVCSSAGVCVACSPGVTECAGNTPRTCSSSGQWELGTACPFVCSGAGVCGGECVPDALECQGKQPRKCDSTGHWQSMGAPCTYVCSNGACEGTCNPGAKQCSSNIPQTCDASGSWQNGTACGGTTPLCIDGSCDSALAAKCTKYTRGPSTYFFCRTDWIPWLSALGACHSAGGDLVTINDSSDYSFVLQNLQAGSLWIGLNDQSWEGNFSWSSGQQGYTKWKLGWTSGGTFEDCAAFEIGGYQDYVCGEMRGYVCEIP